MARLLGLSDEQRLEIEQATGIRTEGVRVLLEASLQQAEQLSKQVLDKTIREVQEVVGPHGSVSRLQAGGVKISQGLGVAVYEDGVLKTTIEPDGDLLVGSDITQPATTSFSVFVNEQTYNNELMGAGDLLFGDNTEAISNVKFDASEGQLQFRYGQTVNVYMDTDGSLKAGGGAVALDEDGIDLPDAGDAIELTDRTINHAHIYMNSSWLKILGYTTINETNIISNGDFETGDLTNWTETDPSNKISVVIVDNYVAEFANTNAVTDYITQNLSVAAPSGCVVTFRSKSTLGGDEIIVTGSGGEYADTRAYDEWRNHIVILRDSTTSIKIGVTSTGGDIYIDDIAVRRFSSGSSPAEITFASDALYLSKTRVLGDLDVDGNVNLLTGNTYDINGAPHTHEPDIDEAILASTFSITAANGVYEDSGLSVDLPSAGTYQITANVRGSLNGTAGGGTTFWWLTAELYNSTDAAPVANSERLIVLTNTAGALLQMTCPINVQVTVAAAKTIKLYVFKKGNGTPAWTTSDITSDANGRTTLAYERIG